MSKLFVKLLPVVLYTGGLCQVCTLNKGWIQIEITFTINFRWLNVLIKNIVHKLRVQLTDVKKKTTCISWSVGD